MPLDENEDRPQSGQLRAASQQPESSTNTTDATTRFEAAVSVMSAAKSAKKAQDEATWTVLKAHSIIREIKLRPSEAAMLLIVSSREGDDGCWASLETLAADAGLHVKTASAALKMLVKRGVLKMTPRSGETNVYRVATVAELKNNPSQNLAGVPKNGGGKNRMDTPPKKQPATPPKNGDTHPSQILGGKGIPVEGIKEGNPIKAALSGGACLKDQVEEAAREELRLRAQRMLSMTAEWKTSEKAVVAMIAQNADRFKRAMDRLLRKAEREQIQAALFDALCEEWDRCAGNSRS